MLQKKYMHRMSDEKQTKNKMSEIEKISLKIEKLKERISTTADADEVDMMQTAIDGYQNKINSLVADKQKEDKKKLSAEAEIKRISDFQNTDEFQELVNAERERQDDILNEMIDDFIKRKRLFFRYDGFDCIEDDDYIEWAEKVSKSALGIVKGNRAGHNKVDERATLALRNERLPDGIILQGKVKVDVGVQDKTAKPVYAYVNIRLCKKDGIKYIYDDNKFDSLNKAWAFAYRKVKNNPKSKSQGSCWALMYCLNQDGSPAMNGKSPYYLKHSDNKWDLLGDNYDEEYFKDKKGVAVEEKPFKTIKTIKTKKSSKKNDDK